jgi:hypothetical protein
MNRLASLVPQANKVQAKSSNVPLRPVAVFNGNTRSDERRPPRPPKRIRTPG